MDAYWERQRQLIKENIKNLDEICSSGAISKMTFTNSEGKLLNIREEVRMATNILYNLDQHLPQWLNK